MTVKANHINIYPSKSPVNASPTQSSFSQTLRALTHGNSLWQNDTKRNSKESVLYPITVEKQMGGWGRDMCAVISQLAHSLLLEIHAPSGGTKNRRKLRWGKRTCWDYINLGMSRKVGSVLHEGHWPFQIILSSKKDRTLYSLPSSAFLMISFPNHCCLLLSLVLHP